MAQRVPMGPGPGPGQPGGFQMQLPIRPQSSRIVDVTPMIPMDEASCLKKLTSYVAFSLRKAPPHDPKEKPRWARSEVQDEKLAQEDILKRIKKLNEKGKPVAEKKLALAPNQSSQITNLLDELSNREHDRNFEWTLAQLERKERALKQGMRETVMMMVYFKRAPLKDLSAVILHQNIERNRHERMMQANRQQQQQHQQQQQQQHQQQQQQQHHQQQQHQQHHQQQQQQQRPPVPPNHGGGQQRAHSQGPAPQIFKIERKQSKTRRDGSRPPVVKKYHSDTSSVDPYDSDYSGSDYSGSSRTSFSTHSRDDRKHKGGRKRTQSYDRRREHHKDYHIDVHGFSPERPGMHHRYSVPDAPRQIPAFDPLAAAYQAGKMDADAERFGLERLEREREMLEIERERTMLERERLAAPRPMMIERPVIVDRPVPVPVAMERPMYPERRDHPRAIVSYGRNPLPPRGYSEGGVRYDDRYVDEVRLSRDEDYFGRVERDAEDYIERQRRPSEFRRASESSRAGIVHNPHPFAPMPLPRRYPPSNDSWP